MPGSVSPSSPPIPLTSVPAPSKMVMLVPYESAKDVCDKPRRLVRPIANPVTSNFFISFSFYKLLWYKKYNLILETQCLMQKLCLENTNYLTIYHSNELPNKPLTRPIKSEYIFFGLQKTAVRFSGI